MKDDAAINAASAKPQRIEWIDSVRGFAMFLVIWGHCAGKSPEADLLIYSFHMPLFFAVSGLLFRLNKYPNIGVCALDKAKKLLLPYLWMALINIPLWYLVVALQGNLGSCATPLDLLVGFLTGEEFGTLTTSPLWFLPCLYFVSVLYWALSWLHEKKGLSIWLSLLIMLLAATVLDAFDVRTVLHIATVPMATFFYGLGHQFMLHKDAVLAVLGYKKHWVRYFAVLVALVALGIWIAFVNGRISMMGNWYNTYGLAVAHSMMLSLATVMLFIVLPKIRPLDYVGKNTLFYLGFHMFFVRLFEVLPVIGPFAIEWDWVTAIAAFFVLIPCAMLVNRYAPWIVARKRPRKRETQGG